MCPVYIWVTLKYFFYYCLYRKLQVVNPLFIVSVSFNTKIIVKYIESVVHDHLVFSPFRENINIIEVMGLAVIMQYYERIIEQYSIQ